MMSNINKKWYLSALLLAAGVLPAYSQEASSPSVNAVWNTDTMLLLVVVFLLLPIYVLSKTLFFAVKMYWERKDVGGGSKLTGLLLPVLMFLGMQSAMAQDATAAAAATPPSYTWLILTVIMVEVIVIAVLGYQVIRILKMATPEAIAEGAHPLAASAPKESWVSKLWQKMNQMRPVEEEADMDTGHDYDGIRELDNVIMPWFTGAFVLSIIFAIVYLWVFHVSGTGLRQEEEYAIAVKELEEKRAAFLATQANLVDESNVQLLTAAGDLSAGKKVYDQFCAVCHVADLGGSVGPNLVDEYWIHGGSVTDVFKLIKYGAVDKGMMAWKDDLTPVQIAQVASFILSKQGTAPAAPKAPQGELYQAEGKADADAAAPVEAAETGS